MSHMRTSMPASYRAVSSARWSPSQPTRIPVLVASLTDSSNRSHVCSKLIVNAESTILPFTWTPKSTFMTSDAFRTVLHQLSHNYTTYPSCPPHSASSEPQSRSSSSPLGTRFHSRIHSPLPAPSSRFRSTLRFPSWSCLVGSSCGHTAGLGDGLRRLDGCSGSLWMDRLGLIARPRASRRRMYGRRCYGRQRLLVSAET
jgi:hypothetical protein